MLKLSPSELAFIAQGVKDDVRNDGRARLHHRHFSLETGVISQANGSARLKMGMTDILVGVKVEIGDTAADEPTLGRMQFTVECSPSASPEFEGRGADELNLELALSLEKTFLHSRTTDLTKLCLIPSKMCWIVYVDAMVLDSGGNLVEALSIATRAALQNTAIPHVEVVSVEEAEIRVADDPARVSRLDVTNTPVCVVVSRIGNNYIVDPTLEEEVGQACRLMVSVNRTGAVCGVQKGGQGGLAPSLMLEMTNVATMVGAKVIETMDALLSTEENSQLGKVGFRDRY